MALQPAAGGRHPLTLEEILFKELGGEIMWSKTSYALTALFRKICPARPLGLAFGGPCSLGDAAELLHNGFRFWSPLETRQAYYIILRGAGYFHRVRHFGAPWRCGAIFTTPTAWNDATLPIRREGLFVINVLSGLTMMAILYAVTGVLTCW